MKKLEHQQRAVREMAITGLRRLHESSEREKALNIFDINATRLLQAYGTWTEDNSSSWKPLEQNSQIWILI